MRIPLCPNGGKKELYSMRQNRMIIVTRRREGDRPYLFTGSREEEREYHNKEEVKRDVGKGKGHP